MSKASNFLVGQFSFTKIFENTTDPTAGKFQPNWEGPYVITRSEESGSYAIHKIDGTPVPRIWNVVHLKRYYQ